MMNNEKISLLEAPAKIGDYIIHNKLPHADVVDVLCAIADMSDIRMFLFNNDMWGTVGENTIKYLQFKNRYINDCLIIINNRNAVPQLAQIGIIEMKNTIYAIRSAKS